MLPNRPGQGGSGEQWRPGDNRPGDRRPNRPGNRPGGDWWSQHHPSHIPNWNQWNGWRNNNRTNIYNNWHNHHWNNAGWWGRNYWNYHPHPHYAFGDYNWWAWATWPSLNSWVGYDAATPVYYNYGENVYYDGDSVYYGDQAYASATDYAAQAEAIATTPPAQPPAEDDWLPLGVFAITQDGQSEGVDPTMFLQLAVSKQGVLAGSLRNTVTGDVKPIEGAIDKATQRAAWTVSGQTRPIMETGLGNLTQDTTPALVHFADGSTQQWLLVRMDQPTDEQAGAPGAAQTSPPQ
jgi:hypothetical protein